MKLIGPTLALFAGLALASAAAAEPGSRQTREFVQAADESDTFELMEAYTALAQSKDPQILNYAQTMIRDHAQTSRTLQDAITRAGLKPPPMAVGASQAPFLAALQSARGRDFDQLYWTHQMLAHNSALVVEQAYAAGGDTPAVRQAAAAALPIIRSHLALAQQMSANLDKPEAGGATGAGESGGGAYPNPAKRKPGSQGSLMGHGGQSDLAYHGSGQLGEEPVEN